MSKAYAIAYHAYFEKLAAYRSHKIDEAEYAKTRAAYEAARRKEIRLNH